MGGQAISQVFRLNDAGFVQDGLAVGAQHVNVVAMSVHYAHPKRRTLANDLVLAPLGAEMTPPCSKGY